MNVVTKLPRRYFILLKHIRFTGGHSAKMQVMDMHKASTLASSRYSIGTERRIGIIDQGLPSRHLPTFAVMMATEGTATITILVNTTTWANMMPVWNLNSYHSILWSRPNGELRAGDSW